MNKILGIRDKELKVLRKGAIMSALTYMMWFCSSFIVSCINLLCVYLCRILIVLCVVFASAKFQAVERKNYLS